MDKYTQTICDHCTETYAARNSRSIIGLKDVKFVCPLCFLAHKKYGAMREKQRRSSETGGCGI